MEVPPVKREDDQTPLSMETGSVDVGVDTQVVASVNPHSVMISTEEFAEDLDRRLGRANGNVYQRKAGVEGVHDGQIMVRLKKKRFIVIDYGVVPTESDIQAAALNPHVSTPDGAGKQKCITPECTKIGVPVLMFDSEPTEPASLYMRSGLCFTCQRILNEKRRTQRKRKSDIVDPAQVNQAVQGPYNFASKKFKMNGEIMELSNDAIIINGSVGGAKVHGEGYGFQEIGSDLQSIVREATGDTDRLVSAVAASSPGSLDSNSAVAFAAAAAAAAVVAAGGDAGGGVNEAAVSAANAAADASTTLLESAETQPDPDTGPSSSAMSSEDISTLYDKAFMSMSKAIFLLSQWKASWDSALAAAVAQETVNATNGDVQDQSTTNMIPLILAAEAKNDDGDDGDKKQQMVQQPQHHEARKSPGGDVSVFGV